MIPPRPKYPVKNNSAEKAVKDFHEKKRKKKDFHFVGP